MTMKNMRYLFLGCGLALEIIAMIFANEGSTHLPAAGAALGMGIGGGLAFIAAAITTFASESRRESP